MIQEPNCHKRGCKHYLGVAQPNDEEKGEKPVCSAYPDGIPEDIAYGSDKHLEVRKDQTGNYVYENDTIKNVLQFLDGLEGGKGKEMAKIIRNNRKFLEDTNKDLTADIKENFETFINDYDLQGYRNELKIMLDISYYANGLYLGKSIITQRQTKDRVNPEPKISKKGKLYYPKNNYPLLEDLKALKNYDYIVMDLNLGELKNKYPGKSIDKILPFEVLSISIKDKTETYNIKSKELLKVAEAAIIKRLKEYYENGTFKRLQNTPSKKQNIRKFANNYLIPVYYYLKQIWPQKSKPFIIQATMDFWGTFYSNPYSDESNFRKEILGES